MSTPFQNKVALVTGGTSGIGQAVAQDLNSRGVRVVISGRDEQRGREAEELAKSRGSELRFVPMDAASEVSVRAAVEAAVSHFGGLDYLLNSAGYEGPLGPLVSLDEETCDQLLAVNIKGPMMAAKHAIPAMLKRGGGCIVNVSSFLGTIPFPLGPGYGASKAALLHLTRSLAAGYGADGIRSYAVCPYITDTAMIERVSGGNEAIKQQLATMNPSGRMASAHDIAKVIVELFAGLQPVAEGGAVLIDAGGEISVPA